MAKRRFLKLEYFVCFLVLIGLVLLFVPFSIENTRQASFISKWNEKFNRVEYMFSVINAHISDDMLKSLKNAKTPEQREKLLLVLVKPYLRINTDTQPKRYKVRYMNKSNVSKKQMYYFDEFYFAENNTIVGIKDIKTETSDDALFLMLFDMNGILPPNRWGNDVFGVSIFDDGRIEPFGQNLDMQELKNDCSKTGTGIACSYYYKIGGGFEE